MDDDGLILGQHLQGHFLPGQAQTPCILLETISQTLPCTTIQSASSLRSSPNQWFGLVERKETRFRWFETT